MRRIALVLLTVVGLGLVIPLSVLFTARAGLGARHWSGATLTDARWIRPTGLLPVPYAGDLGGVPDLTAANPGDFASFSVDSELVVYAANDHGEQLALETLRGYRHSWRVERVAFSEMQLRQAQDKFTRDGDGELRVRPPRVIQVAMNPQGDCVELVVVRLVCIVYQPNAGMAHLDSSDSAVDSTYWDASTLPGTYFVLVTGFPWHIGAGLMLAGLVWGLALWPRCRRVPASAEVAHM